MQDPLHPGDYPETVEIVSKKRSKGNPGSLCDTAVGRLKVCMVESVVYDKSTGKTTSETRFFISSLPVDPKRALEAIRAHWGVEAMH